MSGYKDAMQKRLAPCIVIIVMMLGTACARTSEPSVPVNLDEPVLSSCTEPRPQACTREYSPVCASRDTGIRCVTTPCPSTEWKTYGNACDACADEKVLFHRPGACE